ncbi:MAG: TetR/AcrR family transcriptional regulator [Bacteroidales bacterium]|nr:TetR/AcrR family transcriptional regulator [Bacteroidales bacterium]
MSPRTTNQVKKIREERIEEIMNSALEVFAENGYLSSSISKVAQHAGISKGLLYNYFKSKDELVKEIIVKGLNSLIKDVKLHENITISEDQFVFFVHRSFKSIQSNLKFWKLYYNLIMQPPVLALIADDIWQYVMPFMNILINYYTKKGVENPEAEARALIAMLDGVGLDYISDPKNFPINEVEKIIIKKFK